MVENFAWGKELQWGYYKHPPLFAWVSYFWLNLFGVTNLSYFILSQINIIIGMLFIFLIAKNFYGLKIAVFSVLLLELLPFYTNLGIKFNANSILLSLYPITSYFFIKSLKDNKIYHWILLGFTAALTIYSKYSALCLLLTFLFIFLRFYRNKFLSYGVYLALVVFLITIAPHIYWFIDSNYLPIKYLEDNYNKELLSLFPFKFLLSQALYLLPVTGFIFFISKSKEKSTNDSINLIKYLCFGPSIIMFLLLLLLNLESSSVWGIPNWFLYTLYLLTIRKITYEKILIYFPILILILIIIYEIFSNMLNLENKYNKLPIKKIISNIESDWQNETKDRNLLYVVGNKIWTQRFIFYSKSKPHNLIGFDYNISKWIKISHNKLNSLVICEKDNLVCMRKAKLYLSQHLYISRELKKYNIIYFIPIN